MKAFIFDIDGTLIDSNDFHARAWKRAFAECGKKVSFRQIRPHIGKGSDQLLPVFLTKTEIESMGEKISEIRAEIFKSEYLSEIGPFPKVRELFTKIREMGAHIALASSSKQDEIEQYKTIAQIGDLVEKATSSDDAEKSKPQPDIFRAALAQLHNPEPNSVLVIGDTPYDAIAATKAKLSMIGVLCGGFPESALREAGCREIYRDPADILVNLNRVLGLVSPFPNDAN